MDEYQLAELRARALGVPGSHADTAACGELWGGLIRRELKVVLSVTTEQREYLVLRDEPHGGAPWSGRRLEIVERVFRGASRKALASDLGVGASTISLTLSSALAELGLHCRPMQAPPLLFVLARAARGDGIAGNVTVDRLECVGESHCVVARSVDSHLFSVLTPSQRAVVQHFVHGSTYAEIAARRHTSSRTVANQVAAACRSLGVSGRGELVQFVVSETPAGARPTRRAAGPLPETYQRSAAL